ncbi:RimJ/RimL family protein N-acetyltransferase [Chitinophaga skermanii]|uniref:RimJ/RimL family protein N-acetyltransferase n=1 Tax=Chitinophaga skermanii TaxID=331697 RepID=A0A327PZP4_9BACT|nr:GNAT family N-acetyltransferase [Chitinophaga skermanii]RAI97598.1 RimJ/RimL family protein N-acetyltransferase [Chitinophaga skermanii]
MEAIITTERLVLRKMNHQDVDDLFEMDADPAVHLYLWNKPVKSKEEVVAVVNMINQQYIDNGIGRWAVIDKATHECIGWAGLKLIKEPVNGHVNYYDLGYRFKQKHWGKGYASEAARAVIAYGFEELGLDLMYAITDIGNANSQKVLEKMGFTFKTVFDYDGDPTNWFELTKAAWEERS